MSKYIRTKDEIIDIPYGNKDEKGYYTYDSDNFLAPKKYIDKKDIIKVANTIEDLCDRYVLKDIDIIVLNDDKKEYRFEGTNEWFNITSLELERGIYGAIWTNKGLIYVAKMNDKGELELI